VLCEAYDYLSTVSFTRGVRVGLDNGVMLFISGTTSVNEKGESIHHRDIRARTRRTFHDIITLLGGQGADCQDVYRTTCYLARFRDYNASNEVRNALYLEQTQDPLPAGTCIEARICRPELLVEIENIAMMPKDRCR